MEKIKQRLSNIEKTRLKQANLQFLSGCEKFISKCLEERDKKPKIDKKKPKIDKNKKQSDDKKKNELFSKLTFILGSLAIVLIAVPPILRTTIDKVRPLGKKVSQMYHDYFHGYSIELEQKKQIIKEQYLGYGRDLAGQISDNMNKYLSPNDEYENVSFREGGLFAPLFENVAQCGLFWTMSLGGMEFLANLFGIENPLLEQVRYGIFYNLSKDENVYHHRSDGKAGLEGAKKQVRATDALEKLKRVGINYEKERGAYIDNTGFLNSAIELIVMDFSSDRYDVDREAIQTYVGQVGTLVDTASASLKTGVLDYSTIIAFKEGEHARSETILDFVRYASAKEGFVNGCIEMMDSINTRANRGDTVMGQWITGQTQVTNKDSNRKIWIITGNDHWNWMTDIINYIEWYYSTLPKDTNDAIINFILDEWRSTPTSKWNSYRLYWVWSFLPIVAQHEISNAFSSAEISESFKDNYRKESDAEKISKSLSKVLTKEEKIKDIYGEQYANGLISLKVYLRKIKSSLSGTEKLLKRTTKTAKKIVETLPDEIRNQEMGNQGAHKFFINEKHTIFHHLFNFCIGSSYEKFFDTSDFKQMVLQFRRIIDNIMFIKRVTAGTFDVFDTETLVFDNTYKRSDLNFDEEYDKNPEPDLNLQLDSDRLHSDELLFVVIDTFDLLEKKIEDARNERCVLIKIMIDSFKSMYNISKRT